MSIQSEIERIKDNVARAYSAVSDMCGTLPAQQSSANLEDAVRSIPSGPSLTAPSDPLKVYADTRPADWLAMPMPQDNEMYLLFHIPDGASSALSFKVTCTGSYTVALGTVSGGQFVQQGSASVASGTKYEEELFSSDFGDATADGFKQVMVKVTGVDIKGWTAHPLGNKQPIVEIACRLPKGDGVQAMYMRNLRYFAWYGANQMTNATSLFFECFSLTAVLALDTSLVTNATTMFYRCTNLLAIPELNTSQVTNMSQTFNSCWSLTHIPELDTGNVATMDRLFQDCRGLMNIPTLNTSQVTNMDYMFIDCVSLQDIPQLDTSKVTSMIQTFSRCRSLLTFLGLDISHVQKATYLFFDSTSLRSVKNLNPSALTNADYAFNGCNSLGEATFSTGITGWPGADISFQDCNMGHLALVNLLNSLPSITANHTLTITGNPGISELTEDEKAVASEKGWTLTL